MAPLPATSAPHSRLWSVEELSAYLGIPVPTLYRWRRYRSGPPCHRVGRYLRYIPDEVNAWLREQP
jgi:excisionase family DNA binding protein